MAKAGVIFPQTESGSDPGFIRDYAQTAEALGYDFLLAYDHVLGFDATRTNPTPGAYTHETIFHEPFVLFAYIAAITERIELTTGVIILPQRQTALVAKQAAELDVLSGGRLRMGVGTGWNLPEYVALGQDFHTRGRREAEQITLIRKLWSEPVVDFEGTWDRVEGAGINPLPGRHIPIWMGGREQVVLKRAARLADGWITTGQPDDAMRETLGNVRTWVKDNGRDVSAFGVQGNVRYGEGNPEAVAGQAAAWRSLGATHVALNTMGAGLATPRDHIDAITRAKDAIAG